MPDSPKKNRIPDSPPKSIAEFLAPYGSAELHHNYGEFMQSYEASFGEDDLSKRYTTQLDPEVQDALLDIAPKRFFDGAPPSLKAYVMEQMGRASRQGCLDDMPDRLLRLYLRGEMKRSRDDGRRY
jgi:hypothetical protein